MNQKTVNEILLQSDFIILIQSNIRFSKFTRFLDTEPKEASKTIGQAGYQQKETTVNRGGQSRFTVMSIQNTEFILILLFITVLFICIRTITLLLPAPVLCSCFIIAINIDNFLPCCI